LRAGHVKAPEAGVTQRNPLSSGPGQGTTARQGSESGRNLLSAVACRRCASTAGFPVTDPYDAPLSALREHVENLGAWIAVWQARNEPDAHARRCASDAVDAIDAAIRELHQIRAGLAAEIRQSDDSSAARADELLCGEPQRPPHDQR